jgi:NTP pyrophosphatase (non-canonical NTP hydrolase)
MNIAPKPCPFCGETRTRLMTTNTAATKAVDLLDRMAGFLDGMYRRPPPIVEKLLAEYEEIRATPPAEPASPAPQSKSQAKRFAALADAEPASAAEGEQNHHDPKYCSANKDRGATGPIASSSADEGARGRTALLSPDPAQSADTPSEALTFDAFRAANVARCLKWHPAGIESWSPSDWLTAVTGELGELASLLKMRNRERDGLPGNKFSPTQKQIADEIADVVTYLDLLAHVLGVDLGCAAATKFNEVSERVGFPDRIVLASRPQPVTDAYTLQPARGGNWQAPFHANRTRFGYADRIDDVNDKTLVHLNTGTMRNESEGGVEYLLSLLNRSARGEVSEAEVEAAALAIAKVRFGASVAWPENVVEAKVALEAAARVRGGE